MDKPRTLYISDLDGTLLDDTSMISDESARLLDDAIRHHGAVFTIATARTPATVMPIMRRLPAATWRMRPAMTFQSWIPPCCTKS